MPKKPRLTFSRRFFESMLRYGPEIHAELVHLLEQFEANSRSESLDLEAYEGSKDKRFRTIRFSRGLRGVVWALDGAEYVLDCIVTHDEARRCARNWRCDPATATDAFRVREVDDEPENHVATNGQTPRKLFHAWRERVLVKAGMSEHVARVASCLGEEADFEALAQFAPQHDILIGKALLAGYSIDDAREYARMELESAVQSGETAASSASAVVVDAAVRHGELIVIRTEHELKEALRRSFADWSIFLHPSQREHAYKAAYAGPFILLGGPGTGKTVVAMHRARFLADQIVANPNLFESPTSRRILFCAYSKALVQTVSSQLERLCGAELMRQIDVRTVDSVAVQLLREAGELVLGLAEGSDLVERARQAIAEVSGADEWLTPAFLLQEWTNTILGRLITTLDEYLALKRVGAGRRLVTDQREQVWESVARLQKGLEEDNVTTYPLRALKAAFAVASGAATSPYAHVIVDEAQDLSPVQWRMLRAIVPETPNDLFMVGDAHQRIFSRGAPLKVAGIRTAGRKRTLVLNYRNTVQIIDWALQLVEDGDADDLDEGLANLEGYHGRMQGPEPVVVGYATEFQERDALVAALREWIAEGISGDTIGVMCRSNSMCDAVSKHLDGAGVAAARIQSMSDTIRPGAVSVLTMHRSKGLEFRAVALVGVREGIVPHAHTIEDSGADEEERAALVRQERKVLFTACTRPRERLRVSWSGEPSRFLPV